MSKTAAGPAGSGIPELDRILRGGYPRERLCLLEGQPGSGKTTLGMQFLLEGIRAGERSVYVTFSETADELRQSAQSHGWNLDAVSIVELTKGDAEAELEEEYTVLHSADAELAQTSKALLEEIKKLNPQRLVLDSLSELRMVARDPLRYRRQILALKQTLTTRGCTVIFLEDRTGGPESDLLLQSIAHSVLLLTSELSTNGSVHRRIQVTKMRGVDFIDGQHDCQIVRGGLKVYPRLIPDSPTDPPAEATPLASGIKELDHLMGGPIGWGFGVMLTGPAGSGKSSLAAQLAYSAALGGKQAYIYSFEESANTLINRCERLGIGIRRFVKNGQIRIQKIDPSRTTPGQITNSITSCIENKTAGMVVIDSLNGYLQAMSSDKSLIVHLHELLAYLNDHCLITVLVSAQQGLLGRDESQFDATYLADLVIQLRYFESQGLVRQAISVTKNRGNNNERSIREFDMGNGIRIGQPLQEFQGILTGVPEFVGRSQSLIRPRAKGRKK